MFLMGLGEPENAKDDKELYHAKSIFFFKMSANQNKLKIEVAGTKLASKTFGPKPWHPIRG